MSVAFKEWEVICDALASGRQTILIRKGGIHEGRDGFSFAHESFYLFPTKFHAQNDHVREGEFTPGEEWKVGDQFSITHRAEAVHAVTVTDWEKVENLLPYHIYTPETLKDRFDWEGKGMAAGSIHVAFVKVFKLSEPIVLTYEKRFGGCRSWLEIPVDESVSIAGSSAVMGEEIFGKKRAEVESVLAVNPSP
ncbi:DUF1802 family protein [Luteolibacter sp. AS25]|uniref:DUF1802 family protein n=1 Tax=Luteolibacter sp. AS25 TaxID=3135776 RepID=UPI00398BA7E3